MNATQTVDGGVGMGAPTPTPTPTHANAPPDTLVFSGGGPDGLAFIGCVRHLESRSGIDHVRTLVGCSAGSIIALFLAVGMTSHEIEAWATRGFEDRSLCDVDIEGLLSIVDRLGVDDGERVMASIRSAVAEKLSKSHPRLCASSPRAAAGDPSFIELAKATGRNLVVCVSDLEASERVLLSVDTAPDVGVSLAVRMSISVPVLFTPVRTRLRPGGPLRTYVDGGLFDFCPVAHIVSSGAATSTVAFRVSIPEHSAECSVQPQDDDQGGGGAELSLFTYGTLIARALLMRSTHHSTEPATAQPTLVRTIDVPSLMLPSSYYPPGSTAAVVFDTASLSLEVDKDGIERYIRHGMECASRALTNVDQV